MELKELLMLQSMQGASSGKIDNMYQMLISVGFVVIVQYFDKFYNLFSDYVKNYINKKIQQVEKDISFVKEEVYSFDYKPDRYIVNIRYTEPVDKTKEEATKNKIYLDSLFHHVNKLYNIPETEMIKNDFLPSCLDKDIQITDDIFMKVKDIHDTIRVVLFSKTKTVPEILLFLDELIVVYNKDKTNELDKYQQIFTIHSKKQVMSFDPRGDVNIGRTSKREELMREPPKLTFKSSRFNSNKYPQNVLGDQCKLVFDRVNFFQTNKIWYKDKGVPYHITFMLSGEPGLGKSSCIKAVANDLKRHLFVIRCNEIKTSKQFHDLFTNETIQLITDPNTNQVKTVNIPIDKRIYVLEELDILGSILLDRNIIEQKEDSESINDEELTLDDFLNVLDGNNEYPGRVIFITSNHVDRFDKALLRGGRIDCFVNFVHPERQDIIEYIEFFKDISLTKEQKNKINRQISYADMCQLLISYNTIDEVIKRLH